MSSTSGIELVSDCRPQHSQNPDDSNSESTSAIAPPDPIVDVYSASAHGDLDKLRKFVGEGQTVSVSDGNGYYALQWAVLNNFPDCARFIIEVSLESWIVILLLLFLWICISLHRIFGLHTLVYSLFFLNPKAQWRCACRRQQQPDSFTLGSCSWFIGCC